MIYYSDKNFYLFIIINYYMGKKSFNKDKKMFFDTLTDIKRLVQSNTNSYTS